jgi:hypothetical protein
MKFIIYTNPLTKQCCVTKFAPKEDVEKLLGPLTDQEFDNHCWERSVPPHVINPRWITLEEFPKEDSIEEFFDAWEDNGERIIINLEKAKNLQLEKVRIQRNTLLKEKYDSLLNRANEIGTPDEVNSIKIIKQKLRDITNPLKILKPISLEQIRNATPSFEEF